MSLDSERLQDLAAKQELTELAELYARATNNKDIDLLRELYAADATDDHGEYFRGTASDYLDWLEGTLASSIYCRHHIANHLIAVDGDRAEGEVYTIACNIFPDGKGGYLDNMKVFRFLDRYRRIDGHWRFDHRQVVFDADITRPSTDPDPVARATNSTFSPLTHPLFAPGAKRGVK